MSNRLFLVTFCRFAVRTYKNRNTKGDFLAYAGVDLAMETTTKRADKTARLEYR